MQKQHTTDLPKLLHSAFFHHSLICFDITSSMDWLMWDIVVLDLFDALVLFFHQVGDMSFIINYVNCTCATIFQKAHNAFCLVTLSPIGEKSKKQI